MEKILCVYAIGQCLLPSARCYLLILFREAFDIQSDDHDRYVKTIEQKILSLTSNFEAVVEVNGKWFGRISFDFVSI